MEEDLAKIMPWQPVVMFAKYSTPCSRCHLPISVGNSIYPWQDYDGYQHLKCALQEAKEQGVPLQPPVSTCCPMARCCQWCTLTVSA